MRIPEHHAGCDVNANHLTSPTAMDVDGELQLACGLESSSSTVNSSVIKARKFYGQREKPAKSRRENVVLRNDKEMADNSVKFDTARKKAKNKLKLKPYSKKKHGKPKVCDKETVKKIKAIPGHKISKMISDKFSFNARSKMVSKLTDNLTSLGPLYTSKEDGSRSESFALHSSDSMYDAVEIEINYINKKNDEKSIICHDAKVIDEQSEDSDAFCYKNNNKIFFLESNSTTLDADSKDEENLLGYSVTTNGKGCCNIDKNISDIENSESTNSSMKSSSSESVNISMELLDEESNEGDIMESDSDVDLFDSSLCSIMDRNNKMVSTISSEMCDQTMIPEVAGPIDHESLCSTKFFSKQNLDTLQSVQIISETSNDKVSSLDSCKSIREKESSSNGTYQESENESEVGKGQVCSGNAQGLFKYFKKAAKENQGMPSVEERNYKYAYWDTYQNEKDRISMKLCKRSPSGKNFSKYNLDATIDDLVTSPSILPQSELVSSSKPNVVSHTRKTRKTVSSSPRNGCKKFEQLYIDAGQKNFGHTTCPVCGMVYTKTLPEDVMQHSKYHHDVMQKLKFKGWKSERTLAEYLDGRIIQVNPEDNSLHLKKVSELREIVDKELGFAYAVTEYSDAEKVFLFISNKKIVGCAIAIPVKEAYPVITTQDGSNSEKRSGPALSWCCSSRPVPALCGISRIWVLKQARRQQIASRLIDEVRRHFIYGVEIRKKELAFSDPTPDGRLFAEKYSETPNFLVFR